MNVALTDEQEMLQEAARGALERAGGLAAARRRADGRAAEGELSELAAQQGWLGVGVPEELGGQGGGEIELALLATALGEVAAPGPLLPLQLGAVALARAADHELLASACAGDRGVALALECLDDAAVRVIASGEEASGWRLDGVLEQAFGCGEPEVEVLVVPAATPGKEVGLFSVEAAEVSPESGSLADGTRSVARVRFEGASAAHLSLYLPGAELYERLRSLALVLVACDALGAASRLQEMSLDYVKHRHQFGVPIGSFQAVKHSCAEMMVDLETARSAIYYAAWSLVGPEPEYAVAAATAKWLACDAACRVADSALALHGAVGFTWEHDLHLLLKRVRADRSLFGGSAQHRDRVAEALLGSPEPMEPMPAPV